MKTINRTRGFLSTVLVLSLVLVSCKKSKVGPAGADGAQGPPGNANVKSIIFSVSSWRADSACRNYYYKFHTAELNNSVIKSGAVMLYMGDDNGNEWRPMPLDQKDLEFNFDIELSLLQVFVTSGRNCMPADPGNRQFKLVIIPPAP